MDADISLALSLADEADRITMGHYLASGLKVSAKPDRTPVTEADQGVERALTARLAVERPADQILGEEYGTSGGSASSAHDNNQRSAHGDAQRSGGAAASSAASAAPATGSRLWIIDPIDGTANYLRGVPVWATLIGLVVDGAPVLGVVSAPALGRRWWAWRRGGAHTSDVDGRIRQLEVSQVADLSDASVSYSDPIGWPPGALAALTDGVWRTRAYGDFLSHMLVAEGAVDVAAEPDLAPWDVAALLPIITEAGGRVSGLGGGEVLVVADGSATVPSGLLATNAALHDAALARVTGH